MWPVVFAGFVFAAAERPDPLAAERGCERFRGVPTKANDASQEFELMICPTATGVAAKVQTSSLVSGWSVRQSVGGWDSTGTTLKLKETEFIESRPENGWRFCLIDELSLERTATGLTGTYVSLACDDRAELVLDAIALELPADVGVRPEPPSADGVARVEPVERVEPSPSPSPSNASLPEVVRESPTRPSLGPQRGCACTTADLGSPLGGFGFGFGFGALGLLALTRGPSRTREPARRRPRSA